MGDKEKASFYYKVSKELNPKNPNIYNNFGTLEGEFGNVKKAAFYYREALDIDPSHFSAFRHLCLTGELDSEEILIKKMENEYNKLDIPLEGKVDIGFGLGYIKEKFQEYDLSFSYIKKANDLQRSTFNYDLDSIEKNIVDVILNSYSEKKSSITYSFRPIFIVGMPRSGTTMIERVISNNKDVTPLGELPIISNIINNFSKKNLTFPNTMPYLDVDDYTKMGSDYIDRCKGISSDIKSFITDKMPYNFLYIGIIKNAFPNCKIIYTNRDPLDNCFSLYMLKLTGDHYYSYDLNELRKFYIIKKKIMNRWLSIFGDEIYQLNYESFVKNPVKETKKLFSYCDLEYKENDERFDLNNQNVRTASNHQVRKKLNSKSIGRWKNYQKHLEPFFRELID